MALFKKLLYLWRNEEGSESNDFSLKQGQSFNA